MRAATSKIFRCALLCALAGPVLAAGSLELSDQPIPFKGDDALPKLTPPLLEIGDPFLQPGPLAPGFKLPGGAVWQPRLWVYGQYRSAWQSFAPDPQPRVSEWAQRLDLFANLQLSGTERILVGLRPLNRDTAFSGQRLDDAAVDDSYQDEANAEIQSLFFEGDLGELWPNLDRGDFGRLDWGFAVGRQELVFQDGLLLNDEIDALGLTRNNLRLRGAPWLNNLRITSLFGWNEVGRAGPAGNREDDEARLYALLTAWDTVFGNRGASTFELDLSYLDSPAGRQWNGGFGATQRIGRLNTTLRLLGSWAEEPTALARSGSLTLLQLSLSPPYRHDIIYTNLFFAADDYRSAARGELDGGPLGPVGLLFAARGLGSIPAPLNNRAAPAYGGSVGYQLFLNAERTQLVLELGGQVQREIENGETGGLGLRLRQALGRRLILDIDAWAVARAEVPDQNGARLELLWKF